MDYNSDDINTENQQTDIYVTVQLKYTRTWIDRFSSLHYWQFTDKISIITIL